MFNISDQTTFLIPSMSDVPCFRPNNFSHSICDSIVQRRSVTHIGLFVYPEIEPSFPSAVITHNQQIMTFDWSFEN